MKSLREREVAIGLWLSLANAYSAEVLSETMLDWLLIDAEHAPNTLTTVLAQLQAVRGCRPDVVVRVPCDEPWVIKQHLDIGVRNLMVPMIDTPEQAAGLVRSVRYPQAGRRGVASSTTRASRFGREPNYLADAHKGLFVIAQIETPAALANAAAIAGTEGIDAIFIGPGDLSANLGFLGRTGEPAVREAVAACMATCKAAGVPVGTLVGSVADAALYAAMGADFVAIGSDVGLLSQGADRVVAEGRAAMARR